MQQPANENERAPRSPQAEVLENLRDLMTDEAVARMDAVFAARSGEELAEAIASFNALGASQLDRADAATQETLENETLASRQLGFSVETPFGRALRVERAANGVVTLSDGTLQ